MIVNMLCKWSEPENHSKESMVTYMEKITPMIEYIICAFEEWEKYGICGEKADFLIVKMMNQIRFDLGEIEMEFTKSREMNMSIWSALLIDKQDDFLIDILKRYESNSNFYAAAAISDDPRIK